MSYLVAVHTDQGIEKQSNQDSLCVKEAHTLNGNILMAVICDGMGGLDKGELASASVILALSQWFADELPELIMLPEYEKNIIMRWEEILQAENQKIGNFGIKNKIQLGTTATVLLIINEERYLIGHVGDSRVYQIGAGELLQLTEDQTVVASEIRAGRLTKEEAEMDPRRNILLQCVGASEKVQMAAAEGSVHKDDIFLLCSDGFRHEVTEEEIYRSLKSSAVKNESAMKGALVQLTELDKERQETDNISSILIKIVWAGETNWQQ